MRSAHVSVVHWVPWDGRSVAVTVDCSERLIVDVSAVMSVAAKASGSAKTLVAHSGGSELPTADVTVAHLDDVARVDALAVCLAVSRVGWLEKPLALIPEKAIRIKREYAAAAGAL